MSSVKQKYILIVGLSVALLALIALLLVEYKVQVVDVRNKLDNIQVARIDPSRTTTKYDRNYVNSPLSNEEFSTFDYSTFVDEYTTYADETNIAYSVSASNVALYNVCDRYFNVQIGGIRMSPLVPMAIANVETPGRADHNITWSALFPSKVVPIDMLESMDVTTVVSSPENYKALTNEISTRDRGALQMSPTYGTSNDYYNGLMSGNECDKLALVDTSAYRKWSGGASSKPGDRFHLPDVLLRLSSAFDSATKDMARNNYLPESDVHLYVMCCMYHHRSGVWAGKAHGGNTWNSSDLAYEYSKLISSPEFLRVVQQYSYEHPDLYTIDAGTASRLVGQVCDNSKKYCNTNLVLNYPVKCLYTYVKLAELYGG